MSNSPEALGHKRVYGLEWLPVEGTGIGRPPRALVVTSATPRPRPLVVILPWMWAARSAIRKQVALYHSLGCDVAVYSCWPALAVWVPVLAGRYAAALLSGLAAHLREYPRDILLASFSGAAKGVLCPLLARLASVPSPAAPSGTSLPSTATTSEPCQRSSPADQQVTHEQPQPPRQPQAERQSHRRQDPSACLVCSRLRGIIFDSGPVDFDSSIGVRLFANSQNPWLRRLQSAAGSATAGLLDFCLYEAFESQRRAMWQGLRDSLHKLGLPVLFLYSWSGDALADPQPIHALAAALRSGSKDGPDGGARGKGTDGAGVPVSVQSCSEGGGHGRSAGAQGSMVGEPLCVAGSVAAPAALSASLVPQVREQAWDASAHVAHLREHPLEYQEAVTSFLELCEGGGSRGA